MNQKTDVHILDLVKTLDDLEKARPVLQRSKNVLFVGTRSQIAPIVESTAQKCNGRYVNTRWVGGLLTNWKTMSMCLQNRLDNQLSDTTQLTGFSKEDILQLKKQRARLEKFFGVYVVYQNYLILLLLLVSHMRKMLYKNVRN